MSCLRTILQFEWPATWCYMSVGQVCVAVVGELAVMYWQGKPAVPSAPSRSSRNHHQQVNSQQGSANGKAVMQGQKAGKAA